MPQLRNIQLAVLILAAIFTASLISTIAGCSYLHKLDADLAQSLGLDLPSDPNAPAPEPAGGPTIASGVLEIIAGLLALGGYGGLAKWIHSTRKSANGAIAQLSAQVQRLQASLDSHLDQRVN